MAVNDADSLQIAQAPGHISGSGVSWDTTIVRTGTYSLKVVAPSGANGFYNPLTNSNSDYGCVYIRVTVLPSNNRSLIGASGTLYLRLNTDGSLTVTDGGSSIGTSSTQLTDTTKWYKIAWRKEALAVSGGLLWIDDVLQVSGTVTNSASASLGATDSVAATYTAYFSDFTAHDAIPGTDDYRVVISLPISDNNRGAWTGGVGGTTNLFDAVNNLPPIGTAAETDLTQIESATNSATDDCDLNFQSYTTKGIVAADTIHLAKILAIHGEDISTGTKTGATKLVSNPTAGAEDTFTYGGDSGALGTYPSVWEINSNNTTSVLLPSVTLATAPVGRIGKRTATTRVVSCCFLGIVIAYTKAPAAGFAFPFTRNDRRIVPLI